MGSRRLGNGCAGSAEDNRLLRRLACGQWQVRRRFRAMDQDPAKRAVRRMLAIAVAGLVAACMDGMQEGTSLDPARARAIVAQQSQVLDEIRALAGLPEGDATWHRAAVLARRIGALWDRVERGVAGPTVVVCFERHGLAEIYEERLQWFAPADVAAIRAGGYRPGEYREELSGGWYWVWG